MDTGEVQRQVHGIHHALEHVEPLRHELMAGVRDEDAAHVELDVVAFLLGLEEVDCCDAGAHGRCSAAGPRNPPRP